MPDFLKELSRRNVFRVAATYVIVGWIVLQVASITAPAMSLPSWAVSLVLWLLLTGFPIALLLTWAFEMTPDGARRAAPATNQDVAGAPSILDMALLGALVIVGGVTLAGVSLGGADAPTKLSDEIPQEVKSSRLAIAVLPFADMSPEGNQDWFSDGISEEILHRLAGEKELRVAGRTSSFYFKDKTASFEEIGAALGVGSVLEGSVRKDGNQLRISAQLIEVASGYHIWSGTFDRDLEDAFRIQEDISEAIAVALLREIGVEPTGPEKPPPYKPSVEAYQALLKGRQLYQSSGPPRLAWKP